MSPPTVSIAPAANARTAARPADGAAHRGSERHLRIVSRDVGTGLLGTLLVVVMFATLFAVATLQAVLVRGQMRLDTVRRDIVNQERAREDLVLAVSALEAPDRIEAAAQSLGLVRPPEVIFLTAAPSAPPAAAPSTTVSSTTVAPKQGR